MGLFGKKQTEVSANASPSVSDLGVVFHVMPKDFLGVEATLNVEPTPPPAPVVVPVPVVLPPQPPTTPTRPVPFIVWILLALLFVGAVGAIAYVFLVKSQEQIVEPVTTPAATLPTTSTTTSTTTPVQTEVKTPQRSKDSDSDGLTDIEERMYGTDYRNPDTDGDTYLDGNEVFHRYDPLGPAPSTLLDTGAVKEFAQDRVTFTLTYPTSWKATADLEKNLVTFKTPNVAAILVAWSAKDTDLTLEDWILRNIEETDLDALQPSYTKEGYYTLRSKDDLVAFIEGDAMVFVMTYDLKTSLDISYIQTFAMMANSLTIAP